MKKSSKNQDVLEKKPIRPIILSMKINETEQFVIQKFETVKVTASNIATASGRKYRTNTDKSTGIITVTRIA